MRTSTTFLLPRVLHDSFRSQLISRCYAEISAGQGPLPKTADRLTRPDRSRLQLHKALLHLPPRPQGRVKAHAPPQWRTAPLRTSTRGNIVFLVFIKEEIGRVRQAQTIHASQSVQLKRNVVVKLKL